MKKIFLYLFLCLAVNHFAQQTTQYTQFTFNKYGYNPASAGSNINAGFEIIMGLRKQWVGFTNAPNSNFFSADYTFKPKRSYRFWHSTGIYIANDKAGLFQNFSIYGSYSIHIPLTNKYIVSLGISAGARRFTFASSFISPGDPVGKISSASLWGYPDFIPGIRVQKRKVFFDASVQQLYKNRQAQGDKQIGHKSILTPHIYLSLGKKFIFSNGFIVVPAANLHGTFSGIPSLEMNLMAYYKKRVGLGATIRNTSFVSAIFQIRFLETMTAGFAYDYSINHFNSAYANTFEFMIGITPLMSGLDSNKPKHNVSKCPALDF